MLLVNGTDNTGWQDVLPLPFVLAFQCLAPSGDSLVSSPSLVSVLSGRVSALLPKQNKVTGIFRNNFKRNESSYRGGQQEWGRRFRESDVDHCTYSESGDGHAKMA